MNVLYYYVPAYTTLIIQYLPFTHDNTIILNTHVCGENQTLVETPESHSTVVKF